MAKLIYTAITSLDGYVADASGSFEWAMPDEEVHAFVNDLERPIGTYLYGRRLYEVMVAWETMPTEGEPPVVRDYAGLWRAADKIVYSGSLATVASAHTRIERTFDPTAVRRLLTAAERDVSIGGPTLAAHALRAGLVDEVGLIVTPIVVGGGTAALPSDLLLRLVRTDVRTFGNGMTYLRYRTLPEAAGDA